MMYLVWFRFMSFRFILLHFYIQFSLVYRPSYTIVLFGSNCVCHSVQIIVSVTRFRQFSRVFSFLIDKEVIEDVNIQRSSL